MEGEDGKERGDVIVYIGVDIGSLTTKVVVTDEEDNIVFSLYERTNGKPIETLQKALLKVRDTLGDIKVDGVGTTGSGRYLAGLVVGADIIKNEITAHAVATTKDVPDVQTIFEIGGQDSKIIIVRQGIVVDFAMNTICAAGTGSFLDHQAERLSIPIEEFGDYALKSKNPARIAGRCTVFAESDMIHKQQMGYATEDIIAGLCEALVRNYLNNVGRGKEILPPYVFQGGVAANKGIRHAFEKMLKSVIYVPKNYGVMGAYGMAILARNSMAESPRESKFSGFDVAEKQFKTRSIVCNICPNLCEVVLVYENNKPVAAWGDRCGRWQEKIRPRVGKQKKTEVA